MMTDGPIFGEMVIFANVLIKSIVSASLALRQFVCPWKSGCRDTINSSFGSC